jgi:hypothetical protein
VASRKKAYLNIFSTAVNQAFAMIYAY